MARDFERRRLERRTRLRDRAVFVQGRLQQTRTKQAARDRAELSALYWALEELDRLDEIERVANDMTRSEVHRLAAVLAILDARHAPTEYGLDRCAAGFLYEDEASHGGV